MQPSSLVFLAIIAMWAAYLLPQWVRRRDAMGQTRGRDRDSGALRVLRPRRRQQGGRSTTSLLAAEADGGRGELDGNPLDSVIKPDSPQAPARRAALGRPDAAAHPEGAARSGGAARPGAAVRPDVAIGELAAPARHVGAGDAAGQAQGTSQGVSRGSAQGSTQGSAQGHVLGPAGPSRVEAATSPRGEAVSARVPDSDAPGRTGTRRPTPPGHGDPGATTTGRVAAGRAAAIRRARVLAALLLATTICWLGAALSLLPTEVALLVTALLVADLFALRAVARRREAARLRHPSVRGRAGGAAAGASADGDAATDGSDDAVGSRTPSTGARRPMARSSGAPLRRTLPPAAAARRPAAPRVGKRETETTEAGHPTSDGTWIPVPVPPPTYTLKPMAPRPEPPVLESGRPAGSASPGGAAAVATPGGGVSASGGGAGAPAPVVVGAEGLVPPSGGQAPERYEGVEPPAAQEHAAKRPWDDDREFADDLDLDAVLARRRAVNG